MQGTLIVIKADGNVETRELCGKPSLETLQGLVGGLIETVPLWDRYLHQGKLRDCVAFCDEEGKIKGRPVNSMATILWRVSYSPMPALDDVLVGDVIILFGDDEFMESIQALPYWFFPGHHL